MSPTVGPVIVYTENLEQAGHFYRDLLGLPVASSQAGHSQWLATEPVSIVLHTPEPEWYPPPFIPDRSGILLWLKVEDLEALVRRLDSAGCKIAVRRDGPPRDLAVVLDPEGRRIGLYQETRSA